MFKDKTIIITGASSGIGQAVATAFLKQGANIVINARTRSKLEQFAQQYQEHQANMLIVDGDIGLPSTGQQLVEQACQRFGKVDVLVNNAGTFVPKAFLDVNEQELDSYYATTVKGSYFTSQAVIPSMVKQQDGVIINIGSMWVEHPLEATPCSASQVAKGGMHTLTRHLAIEFAADNIRVNTIAPAVIDTPLYDNLMEREQLTQLANLHPLRKLGQMSDITGWVLHLAGKGSGFVTGQTIHVDGGITAGAHLQ